MECHRRLPAVQKDADSVARTGTANHDAGLVELRAPLFPQGGKAKTLAGLKLDAVISIAQC
jgi:hypothetical protein